MSHDDNRVIVLLSCDLAVWGKYFSVVTPSCFMHAYMRRIKLTMMYYAAVRLSLFLTLCFEHLVLKAVQHHIVDMWAS